MAKKKKVKKVKKDLKVLMNQPANADQTMDALSSLFKKMMKM